MGGPSITLAFHSPLITCQHHGDLLLRVREGKWLAHLGTQASDGQGDKVIHQRKRH